MFSEINIRSRITKLFIIVFSTALLLFLSYTFFYSSGVESTDDAYVAGHISNISSQISGTVIATHIQDTDYVQEGQLLIQIDPTEYKILYEKRKIELQSALQKISILLKKVEERRCNIAIKQSLFLKAQQDLAPRRALKEVGAISVEEWLHAETACTLAQRNLELAATQLAEAQAELTHKSPHNHPLIEEAKNQLRAAFIQLQRCNIYSPSAGHIAKKNIEIGQWASPSRPILSIVPLSDIWIDANFKEIELQNIKPGQQVHIQADVYGSRTIYKGYVAGISAGTGSVFSLLPPQNATGNWIKIVQRVPVRIHLYPDQIERFPLRLGMSVYTQVFTKENTIENIAQLQTPQKPIITDIYEPQISEIETMMDSLCNEYLHHYIETT